MKIRRSFVLVLTLIAVLSLFVQCKSNNDEQPQTEQGIISSADWEQTTKMEYRFGDASVAPQYHRSYTISVSNSKKTITIDSYGDVLLQRQYDITTEEFLKFREAVAEKGISTHEEKEVSGCTGGKTEYIRLYKGDEMYFDAYVYHCGGEDTGTLTLPEGTSDLFRNIIPEDINSLIDSTMVLTTP